MNCAKVRGIKVIQTNYNFMIHKILLIYITYERLYHFIFIRVVNDEKVNLSSLQLLFEGN